MLLGLRDMVQALAEQAEWGARWDWDCVGLLRLTEDGDRAPQAAKSASRQ